VTERVVGASRAGRPLVAYERGGRGGLLLFGAIHGDEPASARLCERFLAQLPEGAAPLTVVPVANPDGLSRLQKNNLADVDLNRNFPASSWQLGGAPGYDGGPRPLSEPESAALAALVEVRRPRVIVAVHQPLACVNWDGPAEELAATMAVRCGLPPRASVGFPTPGSFGAWAGIDRGLPVITLELPAAVDDEALARGRMALCAAWEASA
jgi:murein peptide amidase A